MGKIGLFGIGLDTYWSQFDGLLDRLKNYQRRIKEQMEKHGAIVIDAGLVDQVDKAREAGDFLNKGNVDLVFLYVSTYALSSTVLPVVQRVNAPFVILNLQPVAAIDYQRFNALNDRGKMTGEWLAHCQACSIPEIANVFNRAGIPYDFVTGHLDDQDAWNEIYQWIDASKVAKILRNNNLGVLGHYYGGMLDVYTDLAQQSAVFGNHIDLIEMCELAKLRSESTDEDVKMKIDEFHERFNVVPECLPGEIPLPWTN